MSDRTTIPTIAPEELHDGYRVVAMSDVGKVREENQDFMGHFSVEGAQLLVVADGMGGHSGGFEASRIAVDQVREAFVELAADGEPRTVLGKAAIRANAAVRTAASTNAEMRGMGTTLVMALVEGDRAWLAHVGDSRCYLVRAGEATLLTVDHSRVNRMVEAGLLTPEAAENHPMGHILERSIGATDDIEAEVRDKPLRLVRGDRLVLCSDGFWGLVGGAEIGPIFAAEDLQEAVQEGIRLALERGADDNTTIGALEAMDVGQAEAQAVPVSAGQVLRDRSEASRTLPPTARIKSLVQPTSQPEPAAAAGAGATVVVAVLVMLLAGVLMVVAGIRLVRGSADPGDEPSTEASTPDEASPEAPTDEADVDPDAEKGRREKMGDVHQEVDARKEDLEAAGRDEQGEETIPNDAEPATEPEATPEPATPEPATPEPATPEPATPEPATPEPATPAPDGHIYAPDPGPDAATSEPGATG
jgi:PPM family protein phosphatase